MNPGTIQRTTDRPTTAPAGAEPRGAAPGPVRRTVAALAAVLALAGCGVRLETPPPREPVPDAVEVLRETAVADALLVSDQAADAAAQPGTAPEVVAELTRVADVSQEQVDQLGGEYDSGLSEVLGDASPSPSPSATVPAAPADVLVSLVAAASRTRSAADSIADRRLGRLLASVAASQTLSATRLAALTGSEGPPAPVPVFPAPDEKAAATVPPIVSPDPGVSVTPQPAVAPRGLSSDQLARIVLAEDTAAYALEVRAALSEGEVREHAVARAAVHRERAQEWARLAGVAGTDQDPRRAAYETPDPAVPTEELARGVESALATDYATLVGSAEAGTRRILVTHLIETTLAAAAWGAEPLPFPGLPEQLPEG